MGDGSNESDGSKKAALFTKATKAKIGTLLAPKMDKDLLGFVAENLASETPFKSLVGNVSKHAQAVRRRRQAFLSVKPYVELVEDINDNNPSLGADSANVNTCIKEFVFGAFKEILVLSTMYEQCKIGAEQINPDGYYRAFGATSDQIHLSTGGLTGYLTYGEPTMVSMLVARIEAQESASAVGTGFTTPMTGAPNMALFTGTGSPSSLVDKRPRDHDGMVQQTTPPYGWVCAFCLKPNHSATVCRVRIKEEKKRIASQSSGTPVVMQRPPPQPQMNPAGGAASTAGGDDLDFAAFKRFQAWQKLNP